MAWQLFPKGNREPLAVKEKVGRPTGGIGVSKSVEFGTFSFSGLTMLLGDRKDVGLLAVTILLELCTSCSSSCHHHVRNPLLQ